MDSVVLGILILIVGLIIYWALSDTQKSRPIVTNPPRLSGETNIVVSVVPSIEYDEPQHRILRSKGDEIFKQGEYTQAYKIYEQSYKLSLKEYGSSITVLKRLVKTADKIGDEQLVQKWINECDNLNKKEYNPEFSIFGRTILLLQIKRYPPAIVELNRIGSLKIEQYDYHLRSSYYVKCYRGLKQYKTALMNIILARLYLISHQYYMWEYFPHPAGAKANFTGTIFSTEKVERTIEILLRKCSNTKEYAQFINEIEAILGQDNHILQKLDIAATAEFREYFKNLK